MMKKNLSLSELRRVMKLIKGEKISVLVKEDNNKVTVMFNTAVTVNNVPDAAIMRLVRAMGDVAMEKEGEIPF